MFRTVLTIHHPGPGASKPTFCSLRALSSSTSGTTLTKESTGDSSNVRVNKGQAEKAVQVKVQTKIPAPIKGVPSGSKKRVNEFFSATPNDGRMVSIISAEGTEFRVTDHVLRFFR